MKGCSAGPPEHCTRLRAMRHKPSFKFPFKIFKDPNDFHDILTIEVVDKMEWKYHLVNSDIVFLFGEWCGNELECKAFSSQSRNKRI
jgi:hypothetical protein